VYLASPVGSNVVVVAAARSTGDVILDPTIPIEDVRARVGAIVFGYYRTFGVFGRSASFGGTAPMLRASAQGQIDGVEGRVNRFGQGDVSTRFTVNLLGFPAMDTATFVKRGPRPGLGASIVVNMPAGQYLFDKAINLGTNRWSYKPELGLTVPLGDRWLFDTYFGVWLFSDNDDYLGGTREQAPLMTTQVHLSYNLSRRAWAAVDGTFYSGGRTTVNGRAQAERQNNARIGATLALPLANRQSLRLAVSKGARVRLGSNFTTISAAWNYGWGRGF
jgi:Putative MetA-pathway of phenol degradation